MSGFRDNLHDYASKFQERHGRLPSGPKAPDNTGEPPGGDEMEARLSRLEEAFVRVDANLDRLASDMSAVRVSQARIEERMERVVDRARDMPTPDKVDSMINSKLGIAALLFAGLGALIAAITYAAG